MKKTSTLTALIIILFTFSGCSEEHESIEFNKEQSGGLYEIAIDGEVFEFYNSDETYILNTNTFIPFENFDKIYRHVSEDPYEYGINLELDATGTVQFKDMTARNLGHEVCFVVGDKIIAAPVVMTPIEEGDVLMSMMNQEEVEEIISILER
ncbi:MAG: hypothetical protein GQ574_26355 [Crocinitomix sp.]|nr:hypothetical protein [Crocinitomix sp.]